MLKRFSIYIISNDKSYYIGSAWNKTTSKSRFVKHLSGNGGARLLFEAMKTDDTFSQEVLESGVGETQQTAYEAEEKWIQQYLVNDIRQCLNINLHPSKQHGWAGSSESVAKIAEALRGRKAPWVTRALSGTLRPDISASSWGKPGSQKYDSHRAAISAGMAKMSDKAKADMHHKQVESAKARWLIKQSACRHGHEYTPETTYVVPKTGVRQCRICTALRKSSKIA